MARLLWLAFERPPHPDAVTHPATLGDVLLVLELLAEPADSRQRLGTQLQSFLAQQAGIDPWQRPAIPCRRRSGIYALVPWRLAKWLSQILPAADGVLERTRHQLESWLQSTGPAVANPTITR